MFDPKAIFDYKSGRNPIAATTKGKLRLCVAFRSATATNMRLRLLFGATFAPLFAAGLWALAGVADDLRRLRLIQSTKLVSIGLPSRPSDAPCVSDANGWWLVAPDGEQFFSLGVCMFNQGSDKRRIRRSQAQLCGLATL